MDGLLSKVKCETRGLALLREIARDITEENLVGYNTRDILVV